MLSKSSFMGGTQCPKMLWLDVNEQDCPSRTSASSLAQMVVMNRGQAIGQLARKYFPGGVLVDGFGTSRKDRAEMTRRFIKEGRTVVYEAAFIFDGVFVAADVLIKDVGGWHLKEVKSSTKLKPEYIPDVAIQMYVIQGAGIKVLTAEVVHLNTDCKSPDLSNLFIGEDVTAEARAMLGGLQPQIRFLETVVGGECPTVEPGVQCSKPFSCRYVKHCVPPDHVTGLYGIGFKKAEPLVQQGLKRINQLSSDDFTGPAFHQLLCLETKELVVEPALVADLKDFQRPIAFIDFETVSLAVPHFIGTHPYAIVPAQVSVHILKEDGTLTHHEFIAEGTDDPREDLAAFVVATCDTAKTVVGWATSFEKRCIRVLALSAPELEPWLFTVIDKIVDLWPVVKNNVYIKEFGKSFSIKSVLPALVPGLAYSDLDIGGGTIASEELWKMMSTPGGDPVIRKQLSEYCERDTLGTVKILEWLENLAKERYGSR